MGKLLKKPVTTVKASSENTSGQTKISNFFKNGLSKENKSTESKLFQQIGSNDSSKAGKPTAVNSKSAEISNLGGTSETKENQSCGTGDKSCPSVLKGVKSCSTALKGDNSSASVEHSSQIVIPETQGFSSPEAVHEDIALLDDLCENDSRTDKSPGDDGVIPDTPDPLLSNSNKSRGKNRSFLRPLSLLAKMPGSKTSPPKNNLRKKLKACKSRLSAGGVSVTFHDVENREPSKVEHIPAKDLNDATSDIMKTNKADPSASSVASEEKETWSRIEVDLSPENVDHKNISRKRSAVPGISPNPKRSSSGNSTFPIIDVDFGTGTNDSITCVYSKPVSARALSETNVKTPKRSAGTLRKTNDKKVKRLNSYQCTMQRGPKSGIIEDDSVTCADDEILADILGELHTQISQPTISKVKHVSPKSRHDNKKFTLRRKSCQESSDEKYTGLGSLNEVQKHTIPPDPLQTESATIDIAIATNLDHSERTDDIQTNETEKLTTGMEDGGAVLKGQNLCEDISDLIPDDDSFMDVAGDLPTDGKTESQDLCEEFTHMSPFKIGDGSEALPWYNPTQLHPPAEQFGRHKVTDVQFDKGTHSLVLELESHFDKTKRHCHLHGFWCDTKVGTGDTVHVLDVEFDLGGTCQITDSRGLIVVNPDKLISGTSVVSSVQCVRRSVLNEIFKGCDSSNIYMLYGSIIHAFFQEAVQKGIFDNKQLLGLARTVMTQGKFLHEMYSLKVVEDTVQGEIIKYIPPFQSWLQKFTNIGKFALGSQRPESGITVTKVQDIEENIWSPRFGIKGKIDLTVEAKIWKKGPKPEKKIVPLELKTGKASYSIEHKGQVSLYSMMSGDRREDPHQGLLLYLKEGDMQSIPVNGANKAGLVQLRNEMTAYLQHRLHLIGEEGEQKHVIGGFPEPINSRRTCARCPQLLNCAVFLREVEQCQFDGGHPMSELVPEALSHLSPSHLNYFTRWCLMLELEAKAGKGGRNLKEIWTMPAIEREKTGECLSGMLLSRSEVIDTGQYSLTFTRHPQHPRYRSLDQTGLSLNDTLVISAENKTLIALCTGTLVELTGDHIKISSDRDLKTAENSGLIYRLDKCDIFNTMGSYFTNLSKLMADNPVSANLRKLLIDKEKPIFLPTLSKGAIEKVKTIFKTLNKPQKTAILKVLMCKDYILIKGYPGTGKTSTIVALVKILNLLGYSVLLASYTHSAVDNILLKLKKDRLKFLRLGRVVRIHPTVRPYAAETLVKNITTVAGLQEFYGAQNIVATTCLGSNHPIFTQRTFDVCIVDEASQVLQPACLGPLFSSNRFILVGDPKQLPPVVQSHEARDLGMADSLFSRLDTSGVTYELNLQYRMNSQIMELSNDLIYDGALKCGNEQVANSCLKLPTDQTQLEALVQFPWIQSVLSCQIDKAAIFLDTNKVPAPESRDTSGQIRNEVEAELVSVVTQVFLKGGVGCDDIGVIAPYRNQVKLIRTCLSTRCPGDIEVNTVDQYQGRDKSVIIISFVKSGGDSTAASGELLKDIRRLNVAVTRAKHKLILIGDLPTLERYEPVMKIISVLQRRNQIVQLPGDANKDVPR